MNVELPQHINRLQMPFSWHVAAELCWRVPGHTIYETAPADGFYDCLSIRGPRLRVDINRGGSIHAHVPGAHDEDPPVPGEQVRELSFAPGGVERAVAAVLGRCGLSVDQRRPPTTAETLTYRVIAGALSLRFFDAHWDCRAVIAADEYTETPASAPAADLADIPANQIWALTRDGEVVAHLARGWAVTQVGERLDLLAAYDRGTSVEALAAQITARPTARRSERSVLPCSSLPQRAAEWPADL
ncbi:hypothetical protein ACI782_06890 [Geodermatophilus sp. SYSU D00703]